jgi:hypothetical protein
LAVALEYQTPPSDAVTAKDEFDGEQVTFGLVVKG